VSTVALSTHVAPRMARVCAYCGTHLGYKPCSPSMDGEETHSVCAPCKDKVMAEFHQQRAGQLIQQAMEHLEAKRQIQGGSHAA